MAPLPSIQVQTIGPVVCEAFPWRRHQRLHVTVVVKATFALRHEQPMTVIEPEPIVEVELRHKNNPTRSVRATFDLAPFVPGADIVLVGDACGPLGEPVRGLTTRLALFDASGAARVDKSIAVRGDKTSKGAGAFRRLPLIYELAYGGIGFAANPLGIGVPEEADHWPNLLDPADPTRPACYAPWSRGWPARKRMIGEAGALALAAEIPDLPDTFEWSYFHCAPPDQRTSFLAGDERLVLECLHPRYSRIETQLPRVAAEARIAMGGSSRALALVADLLHIDTHAEHASITWRGNFLAAGHEHIAVSVALALPDVPIPWGDPAPLAAAVATEAARRDTAATLATTFVLSERRPGKDLTLALEPAITEGTVAIDETDVAVRRALPGGWLLRSPGAARVDPPWILEAEREVPRIAPGLSRTLTIADDRFAVDSRRTADAARAVPIEGPELVTAVEPLALLPRRRNASIPIFGDTRASATTIAWRLRPPRASRTVVIKASFDIVPDAPMRMRDQPDLLSGDVYPNGDPQATPSYPSDLAWFKPMADVVLHGHAYAATSRVRGAPVGHARFCFGRRSGLSGRGPETAAFFDRSIAVFGDRRWVEALAARTPGEPARWDRIPLVYERAFGAPDNPHNPVGLGRGELLPNLEDPALLLRRPSDPREAACFAALSPQWPVRKERLGSYGGSWAWERWPYHADDFDFGFWQCAPPSQRLLALRGDEPFALCGVHPEIAVIRGELAGTRARCFVQYARAAGGDFGEICMVLDTAVFDADAMRAQLVWRGVIEVTDADAGEVAALWIHLEHAAGEPLAISDAQRRLFAELAARGGALDAAMRADAAANRDAPSAIGGLVTPPDVAQERKAAALRAEVERRLGAKEPLCDLDLTGADLSGLDLSGASLARTILSRANLRGTRLVGASLCHSDLAGSDLSEAVADGAELERADLTGAKLVAASFRKAKLARVRMFGARADGANFDAADLSRLRADEASFVAASFKSALLDRASLDHAVFADAVLERASLRESGLERASFERAKLGAADLSQARLGKALLTGASLHAANLMRARLDGADLRQVDLRESNLYGALLEGAQLGGARLDGAIVTGSGGET